MVKKSSGDFRTAVLLPSIIASEPVFIRIDADAAGHPDLRLLAAELGQRKMTNVLLEGGGTLLGSFFDACLVDEVHAFIAPKIVGVRTGTSLKH